MPCTGFSNVEVIRFLKTDGEGKVISIGGEGECSAAVTASGCLILSFHLCFLCVLYSTEQRSVQMFLL